jgi:hydroxyquinol 1,2-dioxygenase
MISTKLPGLVVEKVPFEGRRPSWDGVRNDIAGGPMSTRNLADEELTSAVLASFEGAETERFKTIAQSLVKHLHAFASEVQLTEEEWFAGIDFLTRTGHITDDKRQEFILLSDVLGLSMLVVGINNRRPSEATESTVFGPFFVEGSPGFENGDDVGAGAPGEPCSVSGRVVDLEGNPVAGALIEVWQADEDGFYDVQYADLDQPRGRGHLHSGADGRFWFDTVKPEAYPIPADGPVGELLQAGGRGPMRPAHIHFKIEAEGYQTLITHVFADGDEYLDNDAVFGVRSNLIGQFQQDQEGRWRLEYDFVLAAT